MVENMTMEDQYLKEIIKMEKDIKEQNIILKMKKLYLKDITKMVKGKKGKYIMKKMK